MNKNTKDLNGSIMIFKKGNQPSTNVLKNGKGDLSNSYILGRRKKYCQLLKVHWVSDIRQIELRTAEPLVSEPSYIKAEIAVEKLRGCLLPGIDQI
jgi:hypothetical protein